MTKIDQNASKFENFVYFPQKILFSDPVHSVIVYKHGFVKKKPVAAIWGLQGTQNGQKRPQNVPFYAISKINEKK